MTQPIIPFNFGVLFYQDASEVPLGQGAFSEVSGIEATLEPKAIREGGRYDGEVQRAGQITYATVILKRGMTTAPELWNWFHLMGEGRTAARLRVEIAVLSDPAAWMAAAGDGGMREAERLRWVMENALPTKFKAATFSATAAEVGIEELHFVHEGMRLVTGGAP